MKKNLILTLILMSIFLLVGCNNSGSTTTTQEPTTTVTTTTEVTTVTTTVVAYTITFEENGGSTVNDITLDYGATVTAPTEPTKEGYTFGGWYTEAALTNLYSFTTMPENGKTLYAKWIIDTYTLQYINYDGSILYSADFEFNEDLSGVVEPTAIRVGYTFSDWDMTLPSVMPANDVTIQALFIINQYTISFETNGGSAVAPITQNYDSIVTAPVIPTKEYYTFSGWYLDEGLTTEYVFDKITASNITLYAKWQINQYSITFNTNGGSAVTTITQDYGSAVTSPADPTKAGFTFAGWYADQELTNYYTFDTIPAENITLYADWGTEGLNFVLVDTYYAVSIGTAVTTGAIIIPKRYEGVLVKEIYEQGFMNSDITSVLIPNTILVINPQAFAYNSSLAVVTFESGSQLVTIGHHAFDTNISLTSFVFPNTVTSVDMGAFWGSSLLSNVVLSDSLETIADQVFYGTEALTSIIIPASITSIGNGAFCQSGLTSLVFESNSQLESIGEIAFHNVKITDLVIPASVTLIGAGAFSSIDTLITVSVEAGNLSYSAENDVLFNYDKTVLLLYAPNKTNTAYVIPQGVIGIDDFAFFKVVNLTDLTIPNTVEVIDYSAIRECTALTTITFAEDSVLHTIGNEAFYGCSGLTAIVFPNSLTSIGNYAFYNASSLASITFESGSIITNIGQLAFFNATSLTSIIIPLSVVFMGEQIFGISGLTQIYCEAASLPEYWDPNWNMAGVPVTWGYVA